MLSAGTAGSTVTVGSALWRPVTWGYDGNLIRRNVMTMTNPPTLTEAREAFEDILRDMEACGYESRFTLADLRAAARDLERAAREDLEAENARLREALSTLIRAPRIWDHGHFDRAMSYGAGCETCLAQNRARDEARAALSGERKETT
jgi:hypothetical protein